MGLGLIIMVFVGGAQGEMSHFFGEDVDWNFWDDYVNHQMLILSCGEISAKCINF